MSPSIDLLKTKFAAMLLAVSNRIDSKLDSSSAAISADRLTNPFQLNISGDGTATASVSGDAPVTLNLTLSDTPVAPGVYPKVTVDSKGRVIAAQLLLAADIPELPASKVTSGTFSADRIPALDASKVNTGVFDAARIPTLNQSTTGNAATATKLASAFSFKLSGDVVVNGLLDGGSGVNFSATLSDSGVAAGSYGDAGNIPQFTVDAKGRVTGVTLVPVDIPAKTIIAVNEYTTLAVDALQQYDLQTILGAEFANFDIKTAEISVRVMDTDAGSPTYQAYVNAEAVVVYGVKDERYILISNQAGVAIDVYVKVLVHPVYRSHPGWTR